MRALFLTSLLLTPTLIACTELGSEEGGGADLAGIDGKEDGIPGIEVTARLRPGTVDATLTTAVPRPGYVFFAAEGTKVTVEVTRAGSASGLDTLLKVYGPRLADGSYPKTVATDEDAGYGKLSKVKDLEITIPGFYLVELTNGAAVTTPAAGAKARLKLSCTGTCDSEAPIQPLGLDLRWFQRAAERKALSLQAYGAAAAKIESKLAAGPLTNWGVVLDADETIINNSAYQRSRSDLGVGYSPGTWTEWVNKKAATAIEGAPAFTQKIKQLGGKVVLVTNRMDTECAQTEDNLHALNVTYDAILCRPTGTPSDKNPRFAAVAAGTSGLPALTVLAFIGDNIQDFPMLTQEVRKQPDTAFAAFGEKFFMIPNPMYGSWEKNLD